MDEVLRTAEDQAEDLTMLRRTTIREHVQQLHRLRAVIIPVVEQGRNIIIMRGDIIITEIRTVQIIAVLMTAGAKHSIIDQAPGIIITTRTVRLKTVDHAATAADLTVERGHTLRRLVQAVVRVVAAEAAEINLTFNNFLWLKKNSGLS
jgi:hypothetical protein